MRLIKLANADRPSKPFWIAVEKVMYLYQSSRGDGTVIYFADGDYVHVSETPEQVAEMIEDAAIPAGGPPGAGTARRW